MNEHSNFSDENKTDVEDDNEDNEDDQIQQEQQLDLEYLDPLSWRYKYKSKVYYKLIKNMKNMDVIIFHVTIIIQWEN